LSTTADRVTSPSVDASKELGRRILEARAERGWSLADVSSRSGLSRAYINSLERGLSIRPGADAIRRLEDVLGPLQEPPDYTAAELPDGLQRLAEDRRLPSSEVRVLAGLRVRGRQPESAARWRFIYDALVASEAMDTDTQREGDRPGE
jgi:transcriptional regulator with XRE-family HTH domain